MINEHEPIECDAYGELIRDAYESDRVDDNKTDHVHEWEDGHITIHSARYLFHDRDDWRDIEWWGIDRVTGHVLDVGTGAGRHALALQANGNPVVALDVSDGAVEVARRRGVDEVIQADIAEAGQLFRPGLFDTVLLLGCGLSMLQTPERAPGILRMLHTIAAPGARIIGEGCKPPIPNNDRNRALLEMRKYDGRWPGHERTRLRYREFATPWRDQLYAEPDVLNERLTEPNGWRLNCYEVDPENPAYGYIAEFVRVD
ncbi:class I SAM-dependent methyltransferase [Amycolatopsis sp. H20-H5]|uniref:class I SAM-dependent methyltransferase n=1 Tax=Amycolatopsis sp. H20-H5 TaxID=3046309 RepID=UPI002DB64FD9|nr:class I SAM-dependent methyltransferase [Amycolatopsis sp. H20-H5]MEC3978902.1 class I SAM-dependent methyltransferase [Amycolatopsis sp. H20-H5]